MMVDEIRDEEWGKMVDEIDYEDMMGDEIFIHLPSPSTMSPPSQSETEEETNGEMR